MKKFIFLCLSLLLTVLVKPVFAACNMTSDTQQVNVFLTSIALTGKEPIGQVIARSAPSTARIDFTCNTSDNTNVPSNWNSKYLLAGATETNIDHVYSTSIPGVGVRIKWPASRDNSAVPTTYPCSGRCFESGDNVLVELIKTGEVSTGVIYPTALAEVELISTLNSGDTAKLMVINLALPVQVKSGSCFVEQKDKTVDLGNYSIVEINRPGFQAINRDFSINLNCPSETGVKVKFEGTLPAGFANTDGIIATRNDLYDARNVAVKITSNDMPLKLNEFIPYNNGSVNGASEMRLKARLYPLPGARPGNISATLVYSFEIN